MSSAVTVVFQAGGTGTGSWWGRPWPAGIDGHVGLCCRVRGRCRSLPGSFQCSDNLHSAGAHAELVLGRGCGDTEQASATRARAADPRVRGPQRRLARGAVRPRPDADLGLLGVRRSLLGSRAAPAGVRERLFECLVDARRPIRPCSASLRACGGEPGPHRAATFAAQLTLRTSQLRPSGCRCCRASSLHGPSPGLGHSPASAEARAGCCPRALRLVAGFVGLRHCRYR
mmetsp:Transcript_47230/g.103330  ORF Transcript_47230/g.103330 Transcript_47230/m.103330 type:complete len:229 (+) Transcript_47230:67-753(+)